MPKREKLTIQLPGETAKALRILAALSGKSRTAIISELIANYGFSVIPNKH